MKRIGNVYYKICSYENLVNAHMRARQGKGHYRQVREVDEHMEEYLKNLEFLLTNEIYYINSFDYKKEIIVDKGKEREIMKLAYYPHRVVQWAIMLQIQDRFLKSFILDTYASIPERGIHFGVKRVKKILKENPEECKYCLKLDMKKYYPSINNRILFEIVRTKIKDTKLLRLVKIIIFSAGEKGQPIGSLWSQWAGNLYLSIIDHYAKEVLKPTSYNRLCDDIVLFGSSKEELRASFNQILKIANEKLDLKIKENYQIFPTCIRGVDFLGYRFFGRYTLLRKRVKRAMIRKLSKLKDKKVLTARENSQINSYKGWLMYCDSYRLHSKYLKPLHGKIYFVDGKTKRVNVYKKKRRKNVYNRQREKTNSNYK